MYDEVKKQRRTICNVGKEPPLLDVSVKAHRGERGKQEGRGHTHPIPKHPIHGSRQRTGRLRAHPASFQDGFGGQNSPQVATQGLDCVPSLINQILFPNAVWISYRKKCGAQSVERRGEQGAGGEQGAPEEAVPGVVAQKHT